MTNDSRFYCSNQVYLCVQYVFFFCSFISNIFAVCIIHTIRIPCSLLSLAYLNDGDTLLEKTIWWNLNKKWILSYIFCVFDGSHASQFDVRVCSSSDWNQAIYFSSFSEFFFCYSSLLLLLIYSVYSHLFL